MTKDITIRAAGPLDAPALGEVGYKAWCKGIGPHVGPDAHARISPDVFADFAKAGHEQMIVAERDGAVIGFAATEDGDNYISDLWVAPQFEGRGVGTALLGALERVIKARGHATAEVEVLAENLRAVTLYRRLGYAPVWEGVREDDVLGVKLNKVLLAKSIGENG